VCLSFGVHSAAKTHGSQQLDCAILEYAGSDARQDVCLALALDDDAVNAVEMEHVRQQQTRRPAAYNSDLRSLHDASLRLLGGRQ